MVKVFVPSFNVPAGIFHVYTSPYPRYAPRVTPRESISFYVVSIVLGTHPILVLTGAPGSFPCQLPIFTDGLPPLNDNVVPTRSVISDAVWLEVKVKDMVAVPPCLENRA